MRKVTAREAAILQVYIEILSGWRSYHPGFVREILDKAQQLVAELYPLPPGKA